ncbi:protoporphyrinogen/coproporphyrinogen oxidase [Microbacterium sp. YY-01]|uniref:protoporphyrinogen/coproporphyrinogen oxidase n=1 Tax=Microbacterium sp. YY-01 TaxID=3421634 RepID=UPI003D16A571
MTDLPSPHELAERAAQKRVAVIGGGIAGLIAARECAAVGMRVTLWEASGTVGGAIRQGEAAGITFDAGAESFAVRGGHVEKLVNELRLNDRIVEPSSEGAWVTGWDGPAAAPLPRNGILGIPDNPFHESVRRVIGWPGAWRAYLDRLRPPLTVGHQHSLGHLVRSRMGQRVLDRLVSPVVVGVYSSTADEVDIDVAIPGLNGALTQVGSLAGAIASLRNNRPPQAAGQAVKGLRGGMAVLVDALHENLRMLGVTIVTEAPIESIESVQNSTPQWRVHDAVNAAVHDATPSGVDGEAAQHPDATEDDALYDAVIIATDETTARHVLADAVPALADIEPAPQPVIEVITLVLDSERLDAAPRGTGVLTVPGSHRAKALTHATAKWPWLAEQTQGKHIVRVSFGSHSEMPATAELNDDDAAELALSEASALLGVPLSRSQLQGMFRAPFSQAQPGTVIGATQRRQQIRDTIAAVPGLGAAGAWLAGTGLAQVIPDAQHEAERVRHDLLWS